MASRYMVNTQIGQVVVGGRARLFVDLSKYSLGESKRGANRAKECAWLLVQSLLFLNLPLRLYALKRSVLRWLGAKVGKRVVIEPGVKIADEWTEVHANRHKVHSTRNHFLRDLYRDVCSSNLRRDLGVV